MNVLVIEDSFKTRKVLVQGLNRHNHAVKTTEFGACGLSYALTENFDFIILDVELPDISGFDVIAKIRKQKVYSSIMIVSSKTDVNDRIKGLELGADDYLCKPFHFDELLSRIKAIIRRRISYDCKNIALGPLQMNFLQRRLYAHNTEIELTVTEYKIVEHLMLNRDRILSIDQMLNRISDKTETASRNSIEVHISSIRRKLRNAGALDVIKNKRGFGFYITH